MANPVNETPEQARARTAATAQANIEARKANAQSNVNTTTNNQMGAVQPVAPTPQPIAPQPVQVAHPVQQPTQPSYTSQEGITTVSPVTETPEQARARTEATAQANISAREQIQPKPTIAQQVPEVTKEIPISTAPTSMPKKEVPVIDYNSSVGRESEIQKNLQEGLATNPSLFKDKNAFFQAYGYNQADAGKQTLIEKFFEDNAQKVGTPEGIFDLLSAGQRNFDQATKNSPAYTQAQARYDYIAPYKNATATSLYNAMVSGKLSPESGSYQDLVNISGGIETPAMQEAKKKYETKRNIDTINRNAEINHSSSTGTSITPATSPTQTISNDIISTKGISYAEAFKKAVSENPELVKQSTELTAVSNRILELEDQKAEIMKGIEKQYPGITTGAATLLANQQSEAINKEYDQLQNKQAVMTANLNYKTSLAEKMFDYDVKQAETTRQEELAKAASETAFKRQKELADYQAQLSLTTDQKKFEQNLKQQAELASDPYTAIKTVMDEYQKLGVPFTESLATKLQNFKNSGMTIGDYTKQMIKDIQAKPEYKRINEMTLGKLSDREKLEADKGNGWDLQNITYTDEDGTQRTKTVQYNKNTGAIRDVPAGGVSTSATGVGGEPISTDALSLIQKWEGFRDKAYKDSAGVWTIGYGFTNVDGKPVKEGDTMNRSQADSIFADKVANYTNYRNFVKVPLSKEQEAALNSFEYNLGSGIWQKDAMGIIDKINEGDLEGAAKEMKKYVYAGGKVVKGLQNRRNEEAQLITQTTPAIAQEFLGALQRGDFKTSGEADKQTTKYSPAKIDNWNSATATAKSKLAKEPEYISFLDEKAKVMEDENASIYDVMKYSQGGKDMGEERLKSLGKFSQALSQVSDLSKKIQETETGPILGKLRSYNPYDTDAQALKAEINSLIPNLARGVYGEVGVLTDADIENYSKTVPNLKSTQDVNKLVLAMTLKTMINGFKSQIQVDGNAGRDVSGFAGTVKSYENRINGLLKEIGAGGTTTPTAITQAGYETLVNARGKEFADAYLKQKNLIVK